MNIKEILKSLRLNESTISMVLGAIVIVIVGILVINFFRKSDTGEALPSLEIEETSEPQAVKGQTHKVQEGETLWSIAEDAYGSGYNWVDVAKANNINNPSMLEKGQEISLPDVESKMATAVSTQNGNKLKIQNTTYTVEKGDNLWEIAVRKYGDGYRWVDIADENKLSNPNLIHAGNTLQLPR